MALAIAWLLVLLACGLNVVAIRRAHASRDARDAMQATGSGCLTFFVGVAVLGFVLAEAVRHLSRIDDPRVDESGFTAWLDLFSPPGYAALAIGFGVVCAGAWLRSVARDIPSPKD